MCGIAGVISASGVVSGRLEAMAAALAHRGPDGFGYLLCSREGEPQTWINRGIPPVEAASSIVGFAHRRLSIIDLSEENAQPMVDSSGRYCVVYNGEIYNYIEVREELEQLGYIFRTEGDTEVLLNAYAAWGADCVSRFNGMWAFALLDVEKRLVFLSRDRFGIKPLYYAQQDGAFVFASEIKGLLAAGITSSPDAGVLADFLIAGRRPGAEGSFFEGIRQLPPAHSGYVRLEQPASSLEIVRYWGLPVAREKFATRRAVDEFRELLTDAVRLHARSDVPVGTCLSGGIDSSSIVCLSELLRARGESPRYTHSAVGYCASDEQLSEREYIEMVARATSTKVHYVEVSQDEFDRRAVDIVRCQDEPFGSASIAVQWFVFRRAREEGLRVMLDGQGADELLGGYLYNFAVIGKLLLSRGNLPAAALLALRYLLRYGSLPFSLNAMSLHRHGSLLPSPAARLLRAVARTLASRETAIPPPSAFKAELRTLTSESERRDLPDLAGALKAQFERDSLPGLLRFEDRNSMAHSVEARVPFLDYRLVERAFQLPTDFLIRGVKTKHILREATKGILPHAIRTRKDKIGFRASPSLTLRLVDRRREELIRNATSYERDWFDIKGVRHLLGQGEFDASREVALWRLWNTKIWLREHWE